MNKLGIIIKREYLSRVKQKSFIIMTFVTPFLLILLMGLPVWMQTHQTGKHKYFAVVDQSKSLKNSFQNNENIDFLYFTGNLDTAMTLNKSGNYTGVIFVPENFMHDTVTIISNNAIPIMAKNYIKSVIEGFARIKKMQELNIDPSILQQLNVQIPLKTLEYKEGKLNASNSDILTMLGFIASFLIYMFIFMYGVALMKGTMEEKGDRIVEIIISSAKAVELMFGKIIGIALVAFTQFGIWIATVIVGLFFFKSSMGDSYVQIQEILNSLSNINIVGWSILFLVYFIGSYLLYGSLFAAVGAAVDSQTDTQQFVLPITLPLIFAFIFAQSIIQDPSGPLAFWLSIIPFTSPVVMMVRIGIGVPAWEIALSIGLLIVTFIITVYIAAKIFRVGLLAYGQKVTYKDLWKWIKYKG